MHTSNPFFEQICYTNDEAWRLLRLLRSENQSKDVLSGILDLTEAEMDYRIKLISLSVVQAEDFFSAAQRAGISTSPLLLYYGALALSRCLLSTRLPGNVKIANVLTHHGGKFSISQTLSESTIIIKEFGVIPKLMEALSEPILSKQHIELGKLLALLPQLAYEYQVSYNLYPCNIQSIENSFFKAYLNMRPPKEQLDESRQISMPDVYHPNDWYIQNDEIIVFTNDGVYKLRESKRLQIYQDRFFFSMGLEINETERVWLSQYCILYLLSFALGMLVRYHPNELDLWAGHTLAKDRLIVERLIKCISKDIPIFIANLIL